MSQIVPRQDVTSSAITPAPVVPQQTQTNTLDTNDTTNVSKVAQPDPMAAKFAALARKEKAIRSQAMAIKQKEAALKDLETKAQAAEAWKTRLSKDPYGVMLEAGITADQAAALLLQQPNPEDQKFQLIQNELKSVKDAQAQTLAKIEEQKQQQYNDAVKQISSDVKMLVDGNPDFETIKSMGAQDAVTDLITETYSISGRLMTIEEAAQEVEDYLVEKAMEVAKIKKVQTKLNFVPAQATAQQKTAVQQPRSPTLTNSMVQTSVKPSSEKERIARAIAAFNGQKI